MSVPLDAQQLKARVDLAAFVGLFTQLRRSGKQFLGRCPLHNERHPSFYIHPIKQVFHCFGCGAGGDLFAFVMLARRCNFRRALQIVAEFSDGVARASGPRSGPRFGASEGAEPLSPPKAGTSNSQSLSNSRERILAALEASDRRAQASQESNRLASIALATACEPDRLGTSLLVKNRITAPDGHE